MAEKMTDQEALAIIHDAALRLRSKDCLAFAADLDNAREHVAKSLPNIGRFLTITTDKDGVACLVSWQDEEHRILEVVWEAPPIAHLSARLGGGEAVAWHVIHEDGGDHVMLAETVDAKFREALAKAGRTVRPLIYGDTTPPARQGGVTKAAIAAAVAVAHDKIIVSNSLTRPEGYAPYCMRCDGMKRMKQVGVLHWRHDCGAEHDEGISRAALEAALATEKE